MSDERQPVNENEFVYRRIHQTFFDAALVVPVRFVAIRPNQNDATGLSVFRQKFVKPADTLANVDAGKRNEYYVGRLACLAHGLFEQFHVRLTNGGF